MLTVHLAAAKACLWHNNPEAAVIHCLAALEIAITTKRNHVAHCIMDACEHIIMVLGQHHGS